MRKLDGLEIVAGRASAPGLQEDRLVARLRGFVLCARALFRRAAIAKRKTVGKGKTRKPRQVQDGLVTLGGIYIAPYEKISNRDRRLMDWLE